jgi:hypothetical protein
VEKSVIDNGCQTDAAVANHSERYQEGLARQFALGHVVIGHLARQQGALFSGPRKHEKLFPIREMHLG